MKSTTIHRYIIGLLVVMSAPVEWYCYAQPPKNQNARRAQSRKKVAFSYVNKPLVDIINELVALKGINIILPQGALAITSRVTYKVPGKITIDQAWENVIMLLDLAGYTIRPEGDFQTVVKTTDNPNLVREPFELFIDVPVDELPNSEEIIRGLFYLANISIKVTGPDLKAFLTDMLSPTANIMMDQKTNALLLTDKAINIRGVMKILQELDQGGLRETIEVLPLYYVSAQIIDDLFNKQLFTGGPQQNGQPQLTQASYFPRNTKVLALERSNSLVMMGTPSAISLVKDFIIKYIDRPLESGESILHVYDLQYLKASEFAPLLQQLVTPGAAQASGQATGKVTGPRQYFKDVIIQAEIQRKTEQLSPTQPGGTPTGAGTPTTEGAQIGGNRLIIAARKKDWVRIEKLIKDLDKPQPQIALEVLIVDLTLNQDKILGSQVRDKANLQNSISPKFNFQSAQLATPVLKTAIDPITNAPFLPGDALMANLLQILNSSNEASSQFGEPPVIAQPQNLATDAAPGSLIISLNDSQTGGVWAVFQVLNRYANTTILAQPFLITTNHQQATVTIQQERLLVGDADTANTSVALRYETVTAGLTVDIIPHISATNNVNLQVSVNLNEFTTQSDNTRITRVVQTCANVGSGQVLALGGLIRDRTNISVNQTPLLGSIPIVGWFFKNEQKNKEKNNLLIFVSPTIIYPQLQGGVDPYTRRKLNLVESNLDEAVCFENLRDPITRWFFKPEPDYGKRTVQGYTEHSFAEQDRHDLIRSDVSGGGIYNRTPSTSLAFDEENEKLKTLVANEENPLQKSSIESAS